ncbi:hypothetical protein Psal006b_03296 (plasmid) [Piscirickettsia salmonis]|uniref:tRNA(Ile)-lysidine synthetase n=2 Tax=Piscirickettsia salmonis TaxID=1238 RepID=A0AAC8ZQC8_PISSA|nr:hypothetical protein [Piscirickettsia salmonis]ALB24675.1 tRNA(Ile)-lysidine synthetase [Piscirickettsia salmonis]QGO00259.1 hypothetical protein Psal006b_03296 [Piscirickettsia salmonis]QGO03892.1 hypothetical protein Psal008_03309 [Piscirickettsia salmonis]QGO14524.1 hypothetical protein Psal010b_03278 [Piscirickettsia salmonis]QGO21620.1 hypothetical protein Psal013_03316 [Piscirickettsia salmonis]
MLNITQVRSMLADWGDYIQRGAEHGSTNSIFGMIQKYGGVVIQNNNSGNDPYIANSDALEVDRIVNELLHSDCKSDQTMARILVIHYGITGSAAKKQATFRISVAVYNSFLSKGVSYVRGCLNALAQRPA